MTKLGRNNPCYCGSGKKYKKCCLESQKQVETYEPTELMNVSMEHLQHHFPSIRFVNVSNIVTTQTYKPLQLKHMTDNVCQVAERLNTNEQVFISREPAGNKHDLLLMYRGAYRVVHGGDNIVQYMRSLHSFFAID